MSTQGTKRSSVRGFVQLFETGRAEYMVADGLVRVVEEVQTHRTLEVVRNVDVGCLQAQEKGTLSNILS